MSFDNWREQPFPPPMPITPVKRYDSIGSARGGDRGRADELQAGALSIGAFERSRWCLRRTRHLWVLNRLCGDGAGRLATAADVDLVVRRPGPLYQQGWKVGRDAVCLEWGASTPVGAHVE